MKKIIVCALIAIGLCALPMQAQTEKDIRKERKEQINEAKKNLNHKASKAARKQAKELKKEGWTVGAGSLPMEKQLDRSIMGQMEEDAYGKPVNLLGEANSIGESIDAARFAAMEIAKVNLLQQMQQEIAGGIETTGGDQQLSADDAASVMKAVGSFRSIMEHKLTGLRPVVSLYRKLPNKNTECRVVLLYPRTEMEKVLKQALRDELLKDGKRTQKDVDCIINGVCEIE